MLQNLKNAAYFSHRWSLWYSRWDYAKGIAVLVFVNSLALTFPLIVKAIVDRLQENEQAWWIPDFMNRLPTMAFILSLGGLYLCFVALITMGRYLWRVHFVFSGFPRAHIVRQKFFQALLEKDTQFLRSRRVGDFISALGEDSDKVRMTLSFGALAVCDTVINLVLFSVILFYLDWFLALCILPPLILSAGVLVFLSDRLSLYYDRVQDLIGNLTGFAFEIASGVRVIKAFGREKDFHENFVEESRRLQRASVRVARYQSLFVPFLYVCLGLATAFVMLFGGMRVISGELALSSFIAFQLYLVQLDWPMVAMGWFIELFRASKASEKRMSDVDAGSAKREDPSGERYPSTSEYLLENVSYSFDAHQRALNSISLKLDAGTWVGLTGPVGGGKSSLLEILCREIDPTEGKVLWRGQNLRTAPATYWREKILYVPQESYLFSKSLRNNLLLGRSESLEDRALTDLLADLSFDVSQLEGRGGLWTRLGERGTNFSGGQKQRIAIGRAILKQREVYLFDDIFSHLDAETEIKIFETLRKRVPKSATVILVSQRLETLEKQDQIIVLKEGELEFLGKSSEAFQKSEFIRQLQHLQRDQMLRQEGVAG